MLHTKKIVKKMSRKNQNLKEHRKNPLTHFCRVLRIAKNGQKFLLQRAFKEKPCVICNQMKCQGDAKRYRISDLAPAKNSIKAANFNKDSVHTRIVFLKTAGDVFVADIMHHKNCLNKYIKRISTRCGNFNRIRT